MNGQNQMKAADATAMILPICLNTTQINNMHIYVNPVFGMQSSLPSS